MGNKPGLSQPTQCSLSQEELRQTGCAAVHQVALGVYAGELIKPMESDREWNGLGWN